MSTVIALVLILVDMHGVPVAEAAEILGVAEGTVKSRCSRGRTALAALITRDGSAIAPTTDRPMEPGRES